MVDMTTRLGKLLQLNQSTQHSRHERDIDFNNLSLRCMHKMKHLVLPHFSSHSRSIGNLKREQNRPLYKIKVFKTSGILATINK